jgi:hypothetical protein
MTQLDGEQYSRTLPTQGPRYKVQYTGQYPYEAGVKYYAEVRDSWTGVQVHEYMGANKEQAMLTAETRAAELNAPLTALEFTSRLGLHLEALLGDEHADRQLIAEDASAILDHYVGQLRGRVWGPIGRTTFPAPWVDGR